MLRSQAMTCPSSHDLSESVEPDIEVSRGKDI